MENNQLTRKRLFLVDYQRLTMVRAQFERTYPKFLWCFMVEYLKWLLCVSHLDVFQGSHHSFASNRVRDRRRSPSRRRVWWRVHDWITLWKCLGNRNMTRNIYIYIHTVTFTTGSLILPMTTFNFCRLLVVVSKMLPADHLCFTDPQNQTSHQSIKLQIRWFVPKFSRVI